MRAEMTTPLLPFCDRCGTYIPPDIRPQFDGQGWIGPCCQRPRTEAKA